MIPACILGTSHLFPGPPLPSATIAERCFPGKDPARLITATGVEERHWAPEGSLVADLATDAVRAALVAADLPADALERVILVTSAGGDWLVPATAGAVIGRLGIDGRADGFDLMNACVGLLTGLDLAARSVATGSGPVAVVSAELASRYVNASRPRPYGLFGDGAAAVIVGPAHGSAGVRSSWLRNSWGAGPTIGGPLVDAGRASVAIDFHTTSDRMTAMAVEGLVAAVHGALDRAGLTLGDVDHFLPHQPNGPLLQAMLTALDWDLARVDVHVHHTGSLASASVGVSLDRLFRSGRLRPGHRVLLASVGSPLAVGAMLYEA